MKWRVLLLLPLLGGCLSTSLPENPQTAPSAASTDSTENAGFVAPPSEIVSSFGTSDGSLPEQFRSLSLLEESGLAGLADEELLSEEVPDAETLEDNLLLSGEGENPPDNEGQTVMADEDVLFDFPVVENEKVHYFVDYFTGPGRKVFTRWLERSTRYLPMMQEIFKEEGLPLDLTYLSLVESGLNARAYSWAHASGPWQFIDSTGRLFGLGNDWWRDERRDYEKSTRAAAKFLKSLHARFEGDWYLAVASYNAGPGKISRAISMYNTRDFWELSRGKYLKAETKNYVPKLLAVLLIAKEPDKYGFTDLNYLPPLEYDVVQVPTSTDLEVVAKLCEISYDEVKELNPELKRWCTPPGVQNYEVRIPVGNRENFEQRYSLLPEDERANYQRHRVKSGDTLSTLAQRYRIRVDDIMTLNNIRNPRSLRVGTDLILPLRKGLSRLPLDEMKDDYVRSRRQTYTVRKGDSLWEISRKFDVSEKELRVWNKLGWSSTIRPGQVLVVSSKAAPKTASPVRTSSSSTSYKVRSGDSLWSIARQFNVSEKDLKSWNGLSSNVLHPGQVLKVAGGSAGKKGDDSLRKIVYKVKPGDTLWKIGRQFDVATREIMDWNDLGEEHVLRPGDQLNLMVAEGKRG